MKNRYMKYIVPGIVILVGLIVMLIGFYMGAASDYKKSLNINGMEAVIPSDGVKNLDIKVDAAELVIQSSNEVDDFVLTAENVSKGNLDYNVNNGILSFRYGIKKWYNYADMIGLLRSGGKIKLVVPARIDLMDVQITTQYKPSEIAYLSAERVYVEGSRGDVNIKNITADHIEISCGTCNARCGSIKGNTTNLICGSGEIKVTDLSAENLSVSCDSGDTELVGIVNGDGILTCGSGNILMDLYNSPDEFSFKTDGKNVTVDGSDKIPKTEGEKVIDAVCGGMGNIDIFFNK